MRKQNANTIFVSTEESYHNLFAEVKNELLKLDPVAFTENYLKLDGKPFKVSGNGFKYMCDVYRYIALKATNPDGKPIVIVKGRQVGATVMGGALDLYFTASGLFGTNGKPPISVLHCFPSLSHTQRFSQSKLQNLIDTSTNDYINQQKQGYNAKTKKVSSGKPDNMTLKQFKNGCNLWIESIGGDGDRIRGMSCDVALFDEAQDMTPAAIGVALKTLFAAKYGSVNNGVQVYFGTPKAKGSYFERGLWDQSDKRYYFLGCTNTDCRHYFMLSSPGSNEWEKTWLFGQTIKCPNCGNEEDKRILVENGKWLPTEPTDKEGKEKKFVGFHISQMYVPTVTKEYMLSQKPENNPASSERIYYNEVLGEFYSGNDMPITKDEIYEKCRDPERRFAPAILPNERKAWMGIDWGGKIDSENSTAGQSYTCAVVISATGTGAINVEFAYKLRSTDFQHKMAFVNEMFKRYNLRVVGADTGYGKDVINELQKIYGDKVIGCTTSGTMKKSVAYNKDLLELSWNKDHLIEELYELMRKGKVKFPWLSFEKMDWLIDHITSMESRQKMVGGMPRKTYDKGPTPNDGFMALIYGYLAYKWEISRGFTNTPGQNGSSGLPKPILAYMPRMK